MHVLLVPDLQQQLELLREESIVVVEIEAEQWKRLDRGAATHDHLGAAAGQQIQRGELLEQPYGIGGAQHTHRARQPDALGARSGRAQDYCRRRVEELAAMMLADAERVEPN